MPGARALFGITEFPAHVSTFIARVKHALNSCWLQGANTIIEPGLRPRSSLAKRFADRRLWSRFQPYATYPPNRLVGAVVMNRNGIVLMVGHDIVRLDFRKVLFGTSRIGLAYEPVQPPLLLGSVFFHNSAELVAVHLSQACVLGINQHGYAHVARRSVVPDPFDRWVSPFSLVTGRI